MPRQPPGEMRPDRDRRAPPARGAGPGPVHGKPPGPAKRSPDRPPGPSRGFDPVRPPPRRSPSADRELDADAGERLSKRLAGEGLASRREVDEWIEAGWVRVNGRLAVLGQRVRPEDRIDLDPRTRQEQSSRVTVLLHKPIGYVSGQAEDGYQPAVTLLRPENRWGEDRFPLSLSPGHLRGLAPAGRLDIDSTGLLVLTQDGRIARHLIGADSRIEKEYLVRVRPLRPLADDALALLNHGLELDGKPLKPAKVSWANEDQLRFALREGRKRQIRRMCELVGLEVLALKRIRIGRIALGRLPQGQWRFLRDDEGF